MILEILCTWVYISIENGFDSLVCIMIPERYIRNTTDQSDILNKGLYESATRDLKLIRIEYGPVYIMKM